MKAEHISDAMNHLDEDLLEETQAVRSRKKYSGRKWTRWAAAAACLAVGLGNRDPGRRPAGEPHRAVREFRERHRPVHQPRPRDHIQRPIGLSDRGGTVHLTRHGDFQGYRDRHQKH